MAMDVAVSSRLVLTLMHHAGFYGLPGFARVKVLRGVVTAVDVVNRNFDRLGRNESRRGTIITQSVLATPAAVLVMQRDGPPGDTRRA